MCGGNVVVGPRSLTWKSKVVGPVIIPNVKMEYCEKCERKLIFPNEGDKASAYLLEKEIARVSREPIGDFVCEKDAAKILGHSKQGFNKKPKIRSGFIMFTILDGRRFYLKKSVEQFKKRGDGRFNLMEGFVNTTINSPVRSLIACASSSNEIPQNFTVSANEHKN
jgi:hypothetical protein